MEATMQAILGWFRKRIQIPRTTLLLAVETEITLVSAGKPNTYKLITSPRTVPRVVLWDTEGNGQEAKYQGWDVGYVKYNFDGDFWSLSLSMNTAVFNANGECVAIGFNGEENHMGTSYGFLGDERIRYQRVGLGMFWDEPYVFYPEIRVRIRDREAEQPRS